MAEVSVLLGADFSDIEPQPLPGATSPVVGVMAGRNGLGPGCLLVSFAQRRGGITVEGAAARVLVRNVPGHPAVAVVASLRPLGDFEPPEPAVAEPNVARAIQVAAQAVPGIGRFRGLELVIWAGDEETSNSPRMAVAVEGDVGGFGSACGESWRILVDAATGAVLSSVQQSCNADVAVTTHAMATPGLNADICATSPAVVEVALPFVGVTDGTGSYFTDATGQLVIATTGSGPLTLTSRLAGRWFTVLDGADTTEPPTQLEEVVATTLTPPGTATILFNATNANEDFRSGVNAYRHANIARAYLAPFVPAGVSLDDPRGFSLIINSQKTQFHHNRSYYSPPSGSRPPSINSDHSISQYPSPAFGTIIYHEFGHHLGYVNGVSGSSAYHEGMADTVAMLVSDEPEMGIGSRGACAEGARSAQNSIQYPCRCPSDVHECAPLLSGCFWELRNRLLASDPSTYRRILASLAIASIPMHVGGMIGPDIFLTLLTLDDDDGDLANGTPHWNQLQSAFERHGMTEAGFPLGSGLSGAALAFTITGELGSPTPSGGEVPFEVAVGSLYGNIPLDGDARLAIDQNGDGVFLEIALARIAPNRYTGSVPAPSCGMHPRFYLRATTTTGRSATWPTRAPEECATLAVFADSLLLAEFQFDSGLDGWTQDPPASWVQAAPNVLFAPGLPDHDWNLALSSYAQAKNVFSDDQVRSCSITSPLISTRSAGLHGAALLTYSRWFDASSASGDVLRVEVAYDGGPWVEVEHVGPKGPDAVGGWRHSSIVLEPSDDVRLRFSRLDLKSQSAATALIDNVVIRSVRCCLADFDGDSFVNGLDFDGFVIAFEAGDSSADVNGDGFVAANDFDRFVAAFVAGC